MASTATQYSDLLNAVQSYYGTGDEWAEIARYGLRADNCYDILKQVPGVNITTNKNGDVIGYSVNAQSSLPISDIPSAIDSNAQSGQFTSTGSLGFKPVGNASVDQGTGAVTMSSNVVKKTGGVAGAAKAIVGTATAAYVGVSIGGALGKTINSALYNNNPNFWSDILSDAGEDPQLDAVYRDVANFEDFVYEKTGFKVNYDQLNALVGYGSNDTAQMYVDENALALFATLMAKEGFFAPSEPQATAPEQSYTGKELFQFPLTLVAPNVFMYIRDFGTARKYVYTGNFEYAGVFTVSSARPAIRLSMLSRSPFTVHCTTYKADGTVYEESDISYSTKLTNTYINNTPVYGFNQTMSMDLSTFLSLNGHLPINFTTGNVLVQSIATSIFDGTIIEGGGVEGTGNQEGATLPDTSNWDLTDPTGSVLPSLQTQYPGLWDNSINVAVPQPDGTIQNRTYVPVPTPDGETPNTQGLPNPTISGENSNQSTPYIDPTTITEPILNYFRQMLSNPNATPTPQPQPEPSPSGQPSDPTTNPNSNPPNTGTGTSPTTILPTGSASSLWKVYHPSQATIDAFGAWLWSSNFVEQIKKMFNDPMSAIIGLHKIFATPIDAGTANIKVGYLDSGVSSAYVDQQYVTIDCGSVTLNEYFGNVFDYDPYTKVAIYLPFIGVQRLNTAEVMRSTINVVYHVDVFTGACLAEVNIIRDGNGGCLYTFAGDCSARYPLSSGSYMGIVGGILSIAGGIAGTVASGGNMLPAVLGASSAMTHMHTDVKHSGQISGNAGAMGVKTPFLIVLRPQTAMANSYEHFTGRPANKFALIGQASGYIKCKEVHVDNLSGASDKEKEMVASLLKSGIIV